MGKLIGDADQISGYGFSSTYLGNKAQVSNSEWTAHDLRKLARSCWADLGIDYMVAEQMLNHSMTKLDQAYIHTYLADQKRAAIELWHSHLMAIYNPFIAWLNKQTHIEI